MSYSNHNDGDSGSDCGKYFQRKVKYMMVF